MLKPLARIAEADLAAYRARFINRDDVFGRQWDDGGGWVRIPAPLIDDILRAHLRGFVTIGYYGPDHDGRTRWACVDFDTDDGEDRGRRLQRWLAERDVPALVERSAGGRCHLWLFFAAPTAAAPIRRALHGIVTEMGWPPEPGVVEIFPKHDSIDADGFGSLIRGPLGRHRRAGGAIFPVVRYDAATGRYHSGGLPVLLATPTVNLAQLLAAAPRSVTVALASETPRPAPTRRDDPLPVSPVTRAIYERLSVRQLLAEKGIAVNAAGKARCPFHDDHHPSLQDYGTRFHCFGCGAHGDVITLYQLLHRLPERWRARHALCDQLGIDPDDPGRPGRRDDALVRRGPRVVQLSFWRELKGA